MDMQDTLKKRGSTHGDFTDHARITQRLKKITDGEHAAREQRGQFRLQHTMLEAIDMIVHKIGRILAGDPTEPDHWDDIAGYAKITADRLRPDAVIYGANGPVVRAGGTTGAREAVGTAERTTGPATASPIPLPAPLEHALRTWRERTMANVDADVDLCQAIDHFLGNPPEREFVSGETKFVNALGMPMYAGIAAKALAESRQAIKDIAQKAVDQAAENALDAGVNGGVDAFMSALRQHADHPDVTVLEDPMGEPVELKHRAPGTFDLQAFGDEMFERGRQFGSRITADRIEDTF